MAPSGEDLVLRKSANLNILSHKICGTTLHHVALLSATWRQIPNEVVPLIIEWGNYFKLSIYIVRTR